MSDNNVFVCFRIVCDRETLENRVIFLFIFLREMTSNNICLLVSPDNKNNRGKSENSYDRKLS